MTIGRAALLIALAVSSIGAVRGYASTPGVAATSVFYAPPGTVLPKAVRTNVAGRYAVVHVKGGEIESAPVDNAVLLERFSFGWQPLEFLNDSCYLGAHGINPRDEVRLLAKIPALRHGTSCGSEPATDSGPSRDVEAIRRLQRPLFIPWVQAIGVYGISDWYGGGGGQNLYRKARGTWRMIGGGGGALPVEYLKRHGVPSSALCHFRVYNAPSC